MYKLGEFEDKYDIRDYNTYTVFANSSQQIAGPGVTIENARKEHVHRPF